MALIYMPRKRAFILLLLLGALCLYDGIKKNDVKEILVASAILVYATISLIVGGRKKKGLKLKNDEKHDTSL